MRCYNAAMMEVVRRGARRSRGIELRPEANTLRWLCSALSGHAYMLTFGIFSRRVNLTFFHNRQKTSRSLAIHILEYPSWAKQHRRQTAPSDTRTGIPSQASA